MRAGVSGVAISLPTAATHAAPARRPSIVLRTQQPHGLTIETGRITPTLDSIWRSPGRGGPLSTLRTASRRPMGGITSTAGSGGGRATRQAGNQSVDQEVGLTLPGHNDGQVQTQVQEQHEEDSEGPSEPVDAYRGLADRMKEGADARFQAWGGKAHLGRGQYNPNDFFGTIMVLEPRAIGRFLVPWALVTAVAAACAVAVNLNTVLADVSLLAVPYTTPYGLLLTVVGFLQVFRLNRAALRYWEARAAWGNLVAAVRILAGSICTHCRHSLAARDDAVAWSLAFAVACKNLLHGKNHVPAAELAGVLPREDVERMSSFQHMPLYAIGCARAALVAALGAPDGQQGPASASEEIHRATALRTNEQQLNRLVDLIGLMERIKTTPLPLVYVTHLRTSLMLYLLLMPFLFSSSLGWGTIPVVSLVAFFLLGVEGAATECETPFDRARWNHLRMEAACLLTFGNVQEIVAAASQQEERATRLGQ